MQRRRPNRPPTTFRVGGSIFHARTTVNQWVELVQQFSLFSDISPAASAIILAIAQEKHFSRRQKIFLEGKPITQVVLLTSGWVRETQLSPKGGAVILRLTGPGELVGPPGSSRRLSFDRAGSPIFKGTGMGCG